MIRQFITATCEYCKGTLGYDSQGACNGCGAPRAAIDRHRAGKVIKPRLRYGECLETVNLTCDQWVHFNPLTRTYDTPDGTSVAEELVDSVSTLADVFHIAEIRERQRARHMHPAPSPSTAGRR